MVVNFMVIFPPISEKRRGNFTNRTLDFHENHRWFPETKKLATLGAQVGSILSFDQILSISSQRVQSFGMFHHFFGRTFPFGILACSSTENGFMEPFKTMRLMSVTGHPNHSLTIWLDVYGFGWRLWFGEAWVTGPKDHPVVSISGGSLARGHRWWVPLRIGLFSSPFFKWP